MSLDIYEKIPEADTSEFTSAKKVRFDTPIRVDGEPVRKSDSHSLKVYKD